MAIFAEVTENERIIERHVLDIHPLLDYDALAIVKPSVCPSVRQTREL